ncbi:MAG: ABC transporter permease [Chloroflexi bacterium]|nr:MAG: ABC transporter permease [Chloroflexota bacterium]
MTVSLPRVQRRSGLRRIGLSLPVGGLLVAVFVLFALIPEVVASGDPAKLNVAQQFRPPSAEHWLGTDEVGRDLWTRVVHGTRYSLGMALAIVATGAAIGTIYGAAAGFAGGGIDELMMRIVDVFLSLPGFILAMAIAATIGRGIGPLVGALVIVWWPSYARLVRGMVLGLKERPHVEGARALGASAPYIVRRHIVPLMIEQLNVRVTQDLGYALVAVASLSFIGLGVQPPAPEWGLLLGGARAYISSSWWYPVFPGIAIALATVGFSLLGDGLAELLVHEHRTRQ